MVKLPQKGWNKTKINIFSIALNILFIITTLLIFYNYYLELKTKSFIEKTTKIHETQIHIKKNLLNSWYNASKFEIIGQLPNTKTYSRLPQAAKKHVRKPVWELSKNTAGISIRFSSNSSKIKIRWDLNSNINHSNLTPIASKGFDLYTFINGKWQFVGVATPTENLKNEAEIIVGMENKSREYLLNLPLYNGIKSLEIGIDKDALISKSTQQIIDVTHPIIFYGTSITQGASASRPGLTYSSLIERKFNKEVINLGFSGNGRFEKVISEYFMVTKPSVIFLDCTPNSSTEIIRKNLPELIDFIRSKNKTVPIVFIESIYFEFAYFKKSGKSVIGTMIYINEQNKVLNEIYINKSKRYKNLYYVNNKNFIGNDHEGTVDGIHFNDLGHFRAYEILKQKLEKII